MTIEFTVPGNPQALKRHKHHSVTTKSGRSFVGTYDPSKNDKADFLAKCMSHAPERQILGPIEMHLIFLFSRPAAHYGTGKNEGRLKDSAPGYHTKRPDLDNLIKFVKDALNGVFYRDDSQIVFIKAIKKYGHPSVKIKIDQLEEMPWTTTYNHQQKEIPYVT